MWCSSTRKLSQLPSCSFSAPVHSFVQTTPFQTGIYLSTTTSVRLLIHVRRTVSCCFSALRQLRHLRRYVTDDCFRSLVVSLVHSRLDRLRQLCPGRASSILTEAPSVCSQRCGSSGVSPKSLRSCLGRPCNSALAASTTTSRLQGGRHGISCVAWSRSTVPE